jgi:hypothetical protein
VARKLCPASLTLLSELMNYDFAEHDLDDPITRSAGTA